MMSATEQTPAPVVVEIASDGTQWWEIVAALGPLAILAAAIITGVIAAVNLRHRRQADQRSEWWARAQWALDAVSSENESLQVQGLGLLEHLADSELAGPEEIEILATAWEAIIGEPSVDEEPNMGDNGGTDTAKEVPDEHDPRA